MEDYNMAQAAAAARLRELMKGANEAGSAQGYDRHVAQALQTLQGEMAGGGMGQMDWDPSKIFNAATGANLAQALHPAMDYQDAFGGSMPGLANQSGLSPEEQALFLLKRSGYDPNMYANDLYANQAEPTTWDEIGQGFSFLNPIKDRLASIYDRQKYEMNPGAIRDDSSLAAGKMSSNDPKPSKMESYKQPQAPHSKGESNKNWRG